MCSKEAESRRAPAARSSPSDVMDATSLPLPQASEASLATYWIIRVGGVAAYLAQLCDDLGLQQQLEGHDGVFGSAASLAVVVADL